MTLKNGENIVLIVNDVQDQLMLMSSLLRKAGYSVIEAGDGLEGLDTAKEHQPDLIISDVNMPGMDGVEFCRRLRSDIHLHHTPFMLVSALRKDNESVLAGFNAGADDYLESPFAPMRLIAKVSRLIEKKVVEQKLRESEANFRDLFDKAPIAYHELNIEGRYTRVNQTELSMLGYTSDEMVGRFAWDFIESKNSHEYILETLKGVVGKSVEQSWRLKDGSFLQLLVNGRPLHDGEENIIGTRFTLQDITEQKLLEEQLRQAQKLESIGQLAAGIAHEINTPTQFVGDNVRFLQDGFSDIMTLLNEYESLIESHKQGIPITDATIEKIKRAADKADIDYLKEEIPKAMGQALEGTGRITKIVLSMKDFAHPGAKEKQSVNLNKTIESTITVASNEWKYIAKLETDFDSTLQSVPCFASEFNQVILNMIVNAVHAISDVIGKDGNTKGLIKISTKKIEDEWAEIRISDTGAGIKEEHRSRIFDPFYTTKEVGKGTGQGLAIAHRVIAEKHGGTITFETEPGAGTTFIIRLPMMPKDEKELAA